MPKFPWNSLLAGAAILAATVYAAAQHAPGMPSPAGPHDQMHQGGPQGAGGGPSFAAVPTLPGQDAIGAIQEVVQILESDPATDWSKVDIAALREHLIDMNDVTLHAAADARVVGNAVEFVVTGKGRTVGAIKRMVTAHVKVLAGMGWRAKTQDLPDGVTLTVTASEAVPLVKLKALGFIGIMVQGGHHQPHHLMMAKGEFTH